LHLRVRFTWHMVRLPVTFYVLRSTTLYVLVSDSTSHVFGRLRVDVLRA